MNESPSADTGNLSVSIVAGPSAEALLRQIDAIKGKHHLVLAAGVLSPEEDKALEQLGAIARQGEVNHLVIECDSQTPAMAYASLFLAPPLTEAARLTQTVFTIRPADLLDSLVRRGRNADPGSAGFLTEQLEFVNHIVLDGGPEDSDFNLARDIALTLNPRAQVSDLSQETAERLLGGAELPPFDFAAALDQAGWRQLIDEPFSRAKKNRIASFAYRARKPFHPQRFLALLQGGLPGVFRAKGFFWLATRMDLVGGLNLAGSELHCAGAGQWWAARDEHARQHEMPERTRNEWQEPFGDRRQAIAFMGLDFDPADCQAQLEACLLTDAEMAGGPAGWTTLPDPFPSWTVHSHTHECGHDHESGEHECCHH
jgi:G3E family GTPase